MAQKKRVATNLAFHEKINEQIWHQGGHLNTSLALEAEYFNRIIFGGSNAHSMFPTEGMLELQIDWCLHPLPNP